MSLTAVALVLTAALLHAAWNAAVKAGDDRLLANWAIVVAAGVISLPIVAVAGRPPTSVWWVLGITVVVHTTYNLFLVAAYERADLAVAYPIARGTAPLLATIAGVTVLGDSVGAVGVAGVLLVTTGLIVVATARPLRDIRWALATGALIATYTVIDGYGVRQSDNAAQFIATSFVAYAALQTVLVRTRRSSSELWHALSDRRLPVLAAGAANAAGYLLVMVAARTEPLGLVSGLRETSVVFGVLIAHSLLGEHITRRHALAVAVVVVGGLAIATG